MEDTEMKDTMSGGASKVTHISTKGWTLENVLTRGSNFLPIPTVDVTSLQAAEIERLVQKHENSGIPLLMTGFHRRPSWDSHKFSPEWLKDVEGVSPLMVRNVCDRKDRESSTFEYLEYAKNASEYALVDEVERLYAKDAPCPEEWHEWMSEHLPGYLLPFGSGDVSRCMPPESRVETLMTYLGIGDTYTPAHKDSCASVGHNLMVHAGNNASSFWFLTSTGDSYKASMYWRELGQELDHESHVATIDELAKASFPIYVCQQELGGFVIVPPRSCHQVLNSGGRRWLPEAPLTIKMSWSRMIGKSYMLSLSQELRIYQRVCRPEVYRVKATIAAVVSLCSERLHTRRTDRDSDLDPVSRLGYFLPLYKQMLIESYDPHWKTYEMRTLDGESCDCCGADIWQSAMICASCSPEVGGAADNARTPVIICGPCYVDGRSCACETMQPAQARPFDELIDLANNAVTLLHSNQKNKRDSVVEQLSEKDLTSAIHPPIFRVAALLYRYRMSTKQKKSKTCNLYRGKKDKTLGRHNHSIKEHEGVRCEGCHSRACWYHIAEKYNAHIITIATFSDAYQALQRRENPVLGVKSLMSDAWHRFHATGKSTSSSEIPFGQPWVDWLPRLALLFRSSRPLNDSVLLGWYDGAHLGVREEINSSEAIMSLALPSNTSPQQSPPLQSTSASNHLAIVPMKRKAPIAPATDSTARRKRRVAHETTDTEESSVDELSILPMMPNRGPYITRNTALENRVRLLEEEVQHLRTENQAEIADLKKVIATLQARLSADKETAGGNGDDEQTATSGPATGFHWRSLLP